MKQLEITHFPQVDYHTNEALNALCTNLTFAGADVKRILLTSCHAAEGKSFLTMNIMRTLASMGKAVVLVDCDLRRTRLRSTYGIKMPKEAQGLSHYLAHDLVLDDVLYETNIVGAYMVPGGHEVLNSVQLLSSWRFDDLLKQLSNLFDYVLIDAPPIGLIVDAMVIARSCDGALLVVTENAVSKRELIEAKTQIDNSGCPIIGAVMNMVDMKGRGSKYYYYRKYGKYSRYGYGRYGRYGKYAADEKYLSDSLDKDKTE